MYQVSAKIVTMSLGRMDINIVVYRFETLADAQEQVVEFLGNSNVVEVRVIRRSV